jgi:signal recognition particle subunit SRP54
LSVKTVIGRPIAFAATGERIDAFEQFHPDRMAGRILGMGDVLTLIEQAEKVFEQDKAEEAAQRMLEGQFTLDDFLEQLQQLKKMGPLSGIVGMLPGVPKEMKNAELGDDQVKVTEAIIRSMTFEERRSPEIINGSRRSRIAKGSGTQVSDVNRLIKQFTEMQKMMKRMGGMAAMTGKPGKKGKGKVNKRQAMREIGDMLGGQGGLPGFPGADGSPGIPPFFK